MATGILKCEPCLSNMKFLQQGQKFDGVIIDAAITKLDSMEAIEALRQAMDRPQVPSIVLAELKEDMERKTLSNVEVVWKPVKQAALYRALIQIHPLTSAADVVETSLTDTLEGANTPDHCFEE